MNELLIGCKLEGVNLLPSLRDLLKDGLAQYEGCLLLKSQLKMVNLDTLKRLADKTEIECFVNHIHLEDYLDERGCILVEQAVAFSKDLNSTILRAAIADPIKFIIAGDDKEINIRFHVLRPGEEWLSSDLEGYEEAVGVIELPIHEHHKS